MFSNWFGSNALIISYAFYIAVSWSDIHILLNDPNQLIFSLQILSKFQVQFKDQLYNKLKDSQSSEEQHQVEEECSSSEQQENIFEKQQQENPFSRKQNIQTVSEEENYDEQQQYPIEEKDALANTTDDGTLISKNEPRFNPQAETLQQVAQTQSSLSVTKQKMKEDVIRLMKDTLQIQLNELREERQRINEGYEEEEEDEIESDAEPTESEQQSSESEDQKHQSTELQNKRCTEQQTKNASEIDELIQNEICLQKLQQLKNLQMLSQVNQASILDPSMDPVKVKNIIGQIMENKRNSLQSSQSSISSPIVNLSIDKQGQKVISPSVLQDGSEAKEDKKSIASKKGKIMGKIVDSSKVSKVMKTKDLDESKDCTLKKPLKEPNFIKQNVTRSSRKQQQKPTDDSQKRQDIVVKQQDEVNSQKKTNQQTDFNQQKQKNFITQQEMEQISMVVSSLMPPSKISRMISNGEISQIPTEVKEKEPVKIQQEQKESQTIFEQQADPINTPTKAQQEDISFIQRQEAGSQVVINDLESNLADLKLTKPLQKERPEREKRQYSTYTIQDKPPEQPQKEPKVQGLTKQYMCKRYEESVFNLKQRLQKAEKELEEKGVEIKHLREFQQGERITNIKLRQQEKELKEQEINKKKEIEEIRLQYAAKEKQSQINALNLNKKLLKAVASSESGSVNVQNAIVQKPEQKIEQVQTEAEQCIVKKLKIVPPPQITQTVVHQSAEQALKSESHEVDIIGANLEKVNLQKEMVSVDNFVDKNKLKDTFQHIEVSEVSAPQKLQIKPITSETKKESVNREISINSQKDKAQPNQIHTQQQNIEKELKEENNDVVRKEPQRIAEYPPKQPKPQNNDFISTEHEENRAEIKQGQEQREMEVKPVQIPTSPDLLQSISLVQAKPKKQSPKQKQEIQRAQYQITKFIKNIQKTDQKSMNSIDEIMHKNSAVVDEIFQRGSDELKSLGLDDHDLFEAEAQAEKIAKTSFKESYEANAKKLLKGTKGGDEFSMILSQGLNNAIQVRPEQPPQNDSQKDPKFDSLASTMGKSAGIPDITPRVVKNPRADFITTTKERKIPKQVVPDESSELSQATSTTARFRIKNFGEYQQIFFPFEEETKYYTELQQQMRKKLIEMAQLISAVPQVKQYETDREISTFFTKHNQVATVSLQARLIICGFSIYGVEFVRNNRSFITALNGRLMTENDQIQGKKTLECALNIACAVCMVLTSDGSTVQKAVSNLEIAFEKIKNVEENILDTCLPATIYTACMELNDERGNERTEWGVGQVRKQTQSDINRLIHIAVVQLLDRMIEMPYGFLKQLQSHQLCSAACVILIEVTLQKRGEEGDGDEMAKYKSVLDNVKNLSNVPGIANHLK